MGSPTIQPTTSFQKMEKEIQFHCGWRKKEATDCALGLSLTTRTFLRLCIFTCVCGWVCVVPAVKCLIVHKKCVYLAELQPTQQMLLKC